MLLEYINRKKESHFFISKMTKNGKERFYVVKDKSKYPKLELLIELPKGFEFYEHPEDAKVVLRKILKSVVLQDEVEIVTEIMENHITAKDYIIDKTENSIDVYLGHLDKNDYIELQEHYYKIQSYRHILRFEKVNNTTYKAQRFCSLSRYYGWITMETSESLDYLADKYCFHIDKESLLEFWIEGEEDW
ncbi:hypothetical protein [Arcicella rosea]|uniref:Uncharacterized protein n=1 Tax=Arcicella rosea TaxID=502909 RepID=A0A841EVI7_9BACT|nr:hypothetical protein [Arcicella rosea]MBB6005429.1 hypothetical protein [Arcicella rosea]